MAYFVYMLRCSDSSLYTGTTNDIAKRIKTHESGKGAKYVRARLPVKLVYTEQFPSKHEALSREWEIKQWSRDQKITKLNLASSIL